MAGTMTLPEIAEQSREEARSFSVEGCQARLVQVQEEIANLEKEQGNFSLDPLVLGLTKGGNLFLVASYNVTTAEEYLEREYTA